VTLYITLTDTYLTRLIFQKIESPKFYHFDFTCELLNSAPEVIYKISRDDFIMKVVFGVDVYKHCGHHSNADYFVWQKFERISSKQYAINFIPSDIEPISTPPRLMRLKYYRAASDGWKNAANCDTCVEQYQTTVCTQWACRLPEQCLFRIFLQPPSLFGSALHIYTILVQNLVRFELNSDTTYERCVRERIKTVRPR